MRRTMLVMAGCLLLSAAPALAETKKPAALGVQLDDGDGRVVVQKVMPGLTAASVGVREGDVLVAINGKEVANADSVMELVTGISAGDPVVVALKRGDQALELKGNASPRPDGMATGRLRMLPTGEAVPESK